MASYEVKSEITGTVCKVTVNVGDHVAEDDPLVFVESMKMEMPLAAPGAGRIAARHALGPAQAAAQCGRHAGGALAHGQGTLPGLFMGGGLGTPGGAGLVVGGRGITVLQLHKPFGSLQGDFARQRGRCGSGNRS